jgi:hypothetical protein
LSALRFASTHALHQRETAPRVRWLQVGKKNRVVGATLMNQDSSRSHSIFTITIEATERFNSADAAAGG